MYVETPLLDNLVRFCSLVAFNFEKQEGSVNLASEVVDLNALL